MKIDPNEKDWSKAMATKQQCDLCDNEAVDTIEMKSKNTTPIKIDVCESHLAEYKKTMREFTGQGLKEILDVSSTEPTEDAQPS